jgi:hypothetical protein
VVLADFRARHRLQELVFDLTKALTVELTRLASLDLHFNGITSRGALALANSLHLAAVTSLTLSANRIGDEGAEALATSANLPRLITLDFAGRRLNQTISEAAKAVLRGRFGSQVRFEAGTDEG